MIGGAGIAELSSWSRITPDSDPAIAAAIVGAVPPLMIGGAGIAELSSWSTVSAGLPGRPTSPSPSRSRSRSALQGVDLRFDRRGYHFRWPVVAALRLPHCARAPSRRLFGAIPCRAWLVVVAAAALSNDVRNALSPTLLIRMRSVRSHAALCGRAGGFTAAGCGRAARPRL